MRPSTPSDLFWSALSPLLQQLEALASVLQACATYYSWCAGGAAGVALLLLGGLVLAEASGDRGRPWQFRSFSSTQLKAASDHDPTP